MSGPAAVPSNIRLIRGTNRPSRDRNRSDKPVLPALDTTPKPPTWLKGKLALAEFKRLAAVMHANGLLTHGNVSLLGHYAMLHEQAATRWRGKDAAPPASLVAQLRLLAGSLGLVAVNFGARGSEPNRFGGHERA